MASLDFRRAAARLCRAPFETALSSSRAAARTCEPAASASPSTLDARTRLAEVFNADRTALLRKRRPSFWRFRLICDLMFATADRV